MHPEIAPGAICVRKHTETSQNSDLTCSHNATIYRMLHVRASQGPRTRPAHSGVCLERKPLGS